MQHATPDDGPDRFRILTVCVGNVCRSPLAERLLAARLGPGFDVRSGGVRALAGRPMDPATAELATELGADADGFISRQLEPAHVEQADLVLTATRGLRSQVLELVPTALRRTFTVRELALLTRQDAVRHGATGPSALVAAAASNRARVAHGELDLPDPYRRGSEAQRATAELVDEAVDSIAAALSDGR